MELLRAFDVRKIRATGPKVGTEELRVNVNGAVSLTHGVSRRPVVDQGGGSLAWAQLEPGT